MAERVAVILSGVLMVAALLVAGFYAEQMGGCSTTGADRIGMAETLLVIQSRVDRALVGIDDDLSSAGARIGAGYVTEGLSWPGTEGELAGLVGRRPGVVNAIVFSRKGIVTAAAGNGTGSVVNASLGDQAHIQKLLATFHPGMSDLFMAVEGYPAVSMVTPVFLPDGMCAGGVSALVRPHDLIGSIVQPAVQGSQFHVFVMQPDGKILYDPDPGEEGRNLLTDPGYSPFAGLVDAGRKIAAESSGRTTYEYLAPGLTRPAKKEAMWATSGIYGTEWRIVITREIS